VLKYQPLYYFLNAFTEVLILEVNCPTCNILVTWTPENLFRPFCSERCRLIDLGEWFSEERRISDEEPTSDNETITIQLSAEDLALLDED